MPTRHNTNFDSFDLAKLICAFFVVFIHCPPFEQYSALTLFTKNGICRIAVPVFFAITGFLLDRKPDKKSYFTVYWKHILYLYLLWSAVYILFQIPLFYQHSARGILAIVKEQVLLLVFKASYYHLWYLVATLYAIPVLYLIADINKIWIYALIILVLWPVGCLHYSYEWINLYPQIVTKYINIFEGVFNGMFVALPLLLVGVIASRIAKHNLRSFYVKGLFLSCLLWIIELCALFFLVSKKVYLMFVLSLPLCTFFCICLLATSRYHFHSRYVSKACRMCSFSIYCIHPLLITVYDKAFNNNGWTRTLVVYAASVSFALILFMARNRKLNRRIK